MTRARRIAALVIVLVTVTGVAPRSVVRGSSSLYRSTITSSPHRFSGANFSPGTAPVVSHTARGQDETLSWTPVSVSSGTPVTYVVTRIRLGISTVVCTGVNTPVLSSGLMTCTDKKPGSGTITYTEQPTIVASGQTTWSLPASTPN